MTTAPTKGPDAPGPSPTAELRAAAHGLPPLPARLEPWMTALLSDAERCRDLLAEHGSPVNVHDFSPLARHAEELLAAANARDVDARVFVARKANKTLGLVRAAHRGGHGIDVGSERELKQVLDLGIPPEDVVVTSAIKPEPLLRRAVDARATLVLDTLDEVAALAPLAAAAAEPVPVALRLAPTPGGPVVPTRFGERRDTWRDWAGRQDPAGPLRIDGVHFHLHGYDPDARVQALGEAVELVDALHAQGHRPRFVDIGGGLPMSYLESGTDWETFWEAHDAQRPDEPVTWRGEPLRQVYPHHQELVRGAWLARVLDTELTPEQSAAEALRRRGLQLRCEPGRSLLDGCGLTLARVIQRSTTSDGVGLVGLEMNRTQCRSTSDDFLVDPLLVPLGGEPSAPGEAFLVGAYCIEAELILRRRIAFPRGVAVGDAIALPNTGGYLMHILESASHQIPLAANVVLDGERADRDGIDRISPLRD